MPFEKIDDPLEGIEAESRGDRWPQVRVRVDVVEHATAVAAFQILDSADVELRSAHDSLRGLDRVARHVRDTARTPRGGAAASSGTSQTPPPSSGLQTGDGHRLKRPCVLTRMAYSSSPPRNSSRTMPASGSCGRYSWSRNRLSGSHTDGSRAKISSICDSESTTWIRAPLPPWSGLSSAGHVISPARAFQRADVVERDRPRTVDPERVQQRGLGALAQLEREHLARRSARARPTVSSDRMKASASGTARVLPRRYALGLAWLK